MFGIRNLRKPRESSQPNQLDMVGERGFEPPTPWSRSRRFTTLTDWSGSTYKSVGVQPVAPSLHPFVTHPEWGKKQNGTREAHPLNLKRELFEE